MRESETGAVEAHETLVEIVLVEDDDADAELLERGVRAAVPRARITRVETESEFSAALATSPRLVVCDYSLVGWSAKEALARLRLVDSDLPFIVVSGAVGEEEVAALLTAGATDYVMKASLRRLGSAVERALELYELGFRERVARTALRRAAWIDPASGLLTRIGLEAALEGGFADHPHAVVAAVELGGVAGWVRELGVSRADAALAAIAHAATHAAPAGVQLGRLSGSVIGVVDLSPGRVADAEFGVLVASWFDGDHRAGEVRVRVRVRVSVVDVSAGEGARAALRHAEAGLVRSGPGDGAGVDDASASALLQAFDAGNVELLEAPIVRWNDRTSVSRSVSLVARVPDRDAPVGASRLFSALEATGWGGVLVRRAVEEVRRVPALTAGERASTLLVLPSGMDAAATLAALHAGLSAPGEPEVGPLLVELPHTTFYSSPSRSAGWVAALAERGVRVLAGGVDLGPVALPELARVGLWGIVLDVPAFLATGGPRAAGEARATVGFARTLGLVVLATGLDDPDTVQIAREIGCDGARGGAVQRSPFPVRS